MTLEDFVEFTKWSRKEHDMRGYEPHNLIGKGGITEKNIAPYVFPSDDEIAQTGVRGISLSNFVDWNAKKHGEKMIDTWGFRPVTFNRERTFIRYAKIEDHSNYVHDYLKYLKFGYGRATDDASMEIRHGRMSREEGVEMVKRYDHVEPSSLEAYCDFLGITKQKFYESIDHLRDLDIWSNADGEWRVLDSVAEHEIGDREESARISQSDDRVFSQRNRHLYFNLDNPPKKSGNPAFDEYNPVFKVI